MTSNGREKDQPLPSGKIHRCLTFKERKKRRRKKFFDKLPPEFWKKNVLTFKLCQSQKTTFYLMFDILTKCWQFLSRLFMPCEIVYELNIYIFLQNVNFIKLSMQDCFYDHQKCLLGKRRENTNIVCLFLQNRRGNTPYGPGHIGSFFLLLFPYKPIFQCFPYGKMLLKAT